MGGGGGGGDFIARKNRTMPERVEVEIGKQTQTFTIFPFNINENAIIGNLATLPTLSKTYEKNKFFLPWRCPKMSIILSILLT